MVIPFWVDKHFKTSLPRLEISGVLVVKTLTKQINIMNELNEIIAQVQELHLFLDLTIKL